MATATGNVKISELTQVAGLNGGEVIPCSLKNTTGSWESKAFLVDTLASYMYSKLDCSNINTYINSYGSQLTRLERDLGQYEAETTIALTKMQDGYISTTDGSIKTGSSMVLANSISLKEGTIYLLPMSDVENLPADVSFFSKVNVHHYHYLTGTHTETRTDTQTGKQYTIEVEEWGEKTETVYEPISTHYHSTSAGGYGNPSKGYLVYFANEDANVIIATRSTTLTQGIIAVRYGLFTGIAEGFLGVNSDLMKVLVEAITKNTAEIQGLNESRDLSGNLEVRGLNSHSMLQVGSSYIMRAESRAPGGGTSYHGPDMPEMLGQIWVDTANKAVYIATALSTDTSGWTKVS